MPRHLFTENTHAGTYNPALLGRSIYASYSRVGLERDIAALSDLETVSDGSATFNKAENYNTFINPPSDSVNDLSHYDLDLYIGSNDRDIALEITVQTVNNDMNDNKAQLGNDDSAERLDMVNGKFLVERRGLTCYIQLAQTHLDRSRRPGVSLHRRQYLPKQSVRRCQRLPNHHC